jgi:hypothetical protein
VRVPGSTAGSFPRDGVCQRRAVPSEVSARLVGLDTRPVELRTGGAGGRVKPRPGGAGGSASRESRALQVRRPGDCAPTAPGTAHTPYTPYRHSPRRPVHHRLPSASHRRGRLALSQRRISTRVCLLIGVAHRAPCSAVRRWRRCLDGVALPGRHTFCYGSLLDGRAKRGGVTAAAIGVTRRAPRPYPHGLMVWAACAGPHPTSASASRRAQQPGATHEPSQSRTYPPCIPTVALHCAGRSPPTRFPNRTRCNRLSSCSDARAVARLWSPPPHRHRAAAGGRTQSCSAVRWVSEAFTGSLADRWCMRA